MSKKSGSKRAERASNDTTQQADVAASVAPAPSRPSDGEPWVRLHDAHECVANVSPEHADLRVGSNATKTGLVCLSGGARRALEFTVVDDRAMYEGDIDLGSVDELVETMSDVVRNDELQHAAVVRDMSRRWENGQVPIEPPDPAAPFVDVLVEAIEEFHERTNVRFVEASKDDGSLVAFELAAYCASRVGRSGGRQVVRLSDTATKGNVIHELCHVLGLWHEQSRHDRDEHVVIRWPNVLAGYEHNFRQQTVDGDDVGPYDFDSIMHYPADAFSANGLPTIEPLVDANIGQRSRLSAGDIAAIDHLYPNPVIEEPVAEPDGDTHVASADFETELGPHQQITVASGGWLRDRRVFWDVIAVTGSTHRPLVAWTVSSGRSDDEDVEYFVDIENLVDEPIRIQVRSHESVDQR